LVFINWGSSAPIKAVNLLDSTVSLLLTTNIGNLDGIAMNCQGEFLVSSWSPNRISKYNHTFSAQGVSLGLTGLSSPADIYFDILRDTLCIPNTASDIVKKEKVISCISSVQNISQKNAISVWPNPSTGLITIENIPASAYVHVFDISGKEPRIPVKLIHVGNNAKFDMSEVPLGMYLLHIEFEGQKKVFRVVRN
jgi:hypothetical protein